MNEHLHALPAGHRLGEYRIERVLGSGGFGITYYAWDIHLDKPVAIKEYFPSDFAVRTDGATVKPKSTDDQEKYQWGLERVLDEARALAHFKHPHINEVSRFLYDNGTAYIVLEYIEGKTLEQLLQREGRLDAAPLRRLLEELLSGLEKVHQAGFVHRGIKPDNIMLRENGDAVLLDFGDARQAVGRRSKSITSILTVGYAPIEQYSSKGDDIGPWTDLYTLGMVAYRCISGIGGDDLPEAVERALPAHKDEQSKDLTPAVEVARGRYDASLLKAVDWAIQVHKEQRPQSVAAWREALVGSNKPASKSSRPSIGITEGLGSGDKPASQEKHPGGSDEQDEETQRKRFFEVFGRDASPYVRDTDVLTDLHYVSAANMPELARFLLNAGANVHARMKKDGRPIGETLKNKLQGLAKTNTFDGLYRVGATSLHLAAWQNAREIVKLLISHGANVRAKDKNGETPLHWAMQGGAREIAKLLISHGANVRAKDKDGWTPLHWAARTDAREIAQLLISHGADVRAKDKDGRTPRDIAIKYDYSEMAHMLKPKALIVGMAIAWRVAIIPVLVGELMVLATGLGEFPEVPIEMPAWIAGVGVIIATITLMAGLGVIEPRSQLISIVGGVGLVAIFQIAYPMLLLSLGFWMVIIVVFTVFKKDGTYYDIPLIPSSLSIALLMGVVVELIKLLVN